MSIKNRKITDSGVNRIMRRGGEKRLCPLDNRTKV